MIIPRSISSLSSLFIQVGIGKGLTHAMSPAQTLVFTKFFGHIWQLATFFFSGGGDILFNYASLGKSLMRHFTGFHFKSEAWGEFS